MPTSQKFVWYIPFLHMFVLYFLATKQVGGKKTHETAKATFKITIKPRKIYISVHQKFSYSKVQSAGFFINDDFVPQG